MLATLNSSRPVIVRSVRCATPNSSYRLLVAPIRAQTTAHQQSPQQHSDRHEEPSAVEKPQQRPADSVMRPGYAVSRLPSIFADMQREMDALAHSFGMPRMSMWDDSNLFAQPFRMPSMTSQLPAMSLATDIEEDDKAFTIKADVPGMSKDNIKLQVLDSTLTISGERSEETREEGGKAKPARFERRFGSFRRSFTLPTNVNVNGITASAKDGVLTVTIPKAEEEQPKAKEIPIV